MQLNFINTITIISIFQSLFLSISFLIKKDKKHICNIILASIFFVFSIQVVFSLSVNYWSYLSFSKSYEFFYLIYQTAYLVSPLFYLYIKSVTEIKFEFKTKELIHFLPFVIISLVVSILIYGLKIRLLFNYTRFGIILHSFIYILISLNYLKRKGIKFTSFFKFHSAKNLMVFLMLSYIILWIINVQIFAIIKYTSMANWCAYVSSIYALTLFVFLNSIYLLLVVKPDLFVLKQTYIKNLPDEEQKDFLYLQLINYIEEKKPFLEPAISIQRVSEEISIPIRILSQIINEKQQKNFNDFMNTYRIKESEKYLQEKKYAELTIKEIFYRSGFNSKSTFNLVFKRHTGLIPIEYRKKHMS